MLKKRLLVSFITIALLLPFTKSGAQPFHARQYHQAFKVTVFIPLHLDSMFENDKLKPSNSLPGYVTSALDFYNGLKIAIEQLKTEGIAARIKIIDSKSTSFSEDFFNDTLHGLPDLIISAAQSAPEFKAIAEMVRPLKIPLISILPNDGGITGYPQMMLVNSTLKTHCVQMHKLLQQHHSIDHLVLLKIQGNAELKLTQYLQAANVSTKAVPIKWKEFNFNDTLTANGLARILDSTRVNIIIAPTLNGQHATKLVKMLSTLSPVYRSEVFGMPTWETVNFSKPDFKAVDVWYSTPFITSNTPELNEDFLKKYRDLTNSKAGDMAYRGYEVTLRYIKTLAKFGTASFMDHVNDPDLQLFNSFKFQPVSVTDNSRTDYLENNKIYFVKKNQGNLKSVMSPL